MCRCHNYVMVSRLPLALFLYLAALAALLSSGCAVVETGASVVKSTASVATATVGVATTVVGTTVTAGSAAVSAASTAKSVTVAAVGTAVAAGSLAVTGVQSMAQARRADDMATASVVATAPDRFSAVDGRKWVTKHCADIVVGQPGLWVALRSGENEIRISAGMSCPVLLLE